MDGEHGVLNCYCAPLTASRSVRMIRSDLHLATLSETSIP